MCSGALPFWVAAGQTPDEARSGKDAPMYREAARLQDLLRPLKGRDRREYADLSRLDNRAGTGWLPGILKLEQEIMSGALELLTGTPTPARLAEYQKSSAARALAYLSQAGTRTTETGETIIWADALSLDVEGRGWAETKTPYDRLPAKAEGAVRNAVWQLGLNSAGLNVRFVTDAPTIQARWSLRDGQLALPHMPATGVSGVDLYVRTEEGSWRWLGTGRATAPTNTATQKDKSAPTA